MRDFLRRWFGPDRHHAHVGRTYSDRLRVRSLAVGLLGVGLGVGGILLLGDTQWREVLAGALLAWSVAVIAWGPKAYRDRRGDTLKEIRHLAEMDVLHARLNQIGARSGVMPLGLDAEIEHVTSFRERRLAHYANLDDFAPEIHGHEEGLAFWAQNDVGGGL